MINTYQTSLAPPPVPPRHNRSHPVLIPAPHPSQVTQQSHSKSLIRFLVGVVLLQLFLSIGGFVYLYNNDKMIRLPSDDGKVAYSSSDKQRTSLKVLAHMLVDSSTKNKTTPGYLIWDINHSLRKEINYYKQSWLTILEPGYYYVYSRVTFSKADPESAVGSTVKLRKKENGKEEAVMQAFCTLDKHSRSASQQCTASQGVVITLEKGNQLSVWVKDLSLVNYVASATTFGMYKL